MRGLATVAAILVALALLVARPGFTQQQSGTDVSKELEALKEGQARMQRELELRKDLETLKEGQVRLQKDIQEIKALLQARPATAPAGPVAGQPLAAVFTVENAPFKGEKNAMVTLLEFTDYQ
jgi:protein-disulfide isomerase